MSGTSATKRKRVDFEDPVYGGLLIPRKKKKTVGGAPGNRPSSKPERWTIFLKENATWTFLLPDKERAGFIGSGFEKLTPAGGGRRGGWFKGRSTKVGLPPSAYSSQGEQDSYKRRREFARERFSRNNKGAEPSGCRSPPSASMTGDSFNASQLRDPLPTTTSSSSLALSSPPPPPQRTTRGSKGLIDTVLLQFLFGRMGHSSTFCLECDSCKHVSYHFTLKGFPRSSPKRRTPFRIGNVKADGGDVWILQSGIGPEAISKTFLRCISEIHRSQLAFDRSFSMRGWENSPRFRRLPGSSSLDSEASLNEMVEHMSGMFAFFLMNPMRISYEGGVIKVYDSFVTELDRRFAMSNEENPDKYRRRAFRKEDEETPRLGLFLTVSRNPRLTRHWWREFTISEGPRCR